MTPTNEMLALADDLIQQAKNRTDHFRPKIYRVTLEYRAAQELRRLAATPSARDVREKLIRWAQSKDAANIGRKTGEKWADEIIALTVPAAKAPAVSEADVGRALFITPSEPKAVAARLSFYASTSTYAPQSLLAEAAQVITAFIQSAAKGDGTKSAENVFASPREDIASIPADACEQLTIRTASEIENQRLSGKLPSDPPSQEASAPITVEKETP